MVSYKKWLNSFIIVPITLLMSVDSFLYRGGVDLSIGELLILKIFERVAVGDLRVFVLMIDKLVYMVLFHILYGNLISEEFRYNSVYLFSRIGDRKKWFYKKSVILFLFSVSYTFVFLSTNLFLCMGSSTQRLSYRDIGIFFTLFLIISLTLMFTTLIMNLISLKFGSSIGFIITYSVIVILIFLSLYGNELPFPDEFAFIKLLNPMSGIHVGVMENLSAQAVFIAYYLLLVAAVILVGAAMINHMDIALSDAESK